MEFSTGALYSLFLESSDTLLSSKIIESYTSARLTTFLLFNSSEEKRQSSYYRQIVSVNNNNKKRRGIHLAQVKYIKIMF